MTAEAQHAQQMKTHGEVANAGQPNKRLNTHHLTCHFSRCQASRRHEYSIMMRKKRKNSLTSRARASLTTSHCTSVNLIIPLQDEHGGDKCAQPRS